MRIIKPSSEILSYTPNLETMIELAGRVCYKSEDKITEDSASEFISKICINKHESVLEHGSITVRFVCDRGVSHELVRHRLASFSQESTRYCNYSKDKFDNQITVIEPLFFGKDSDLYNIWYNSCLEAERGYFSLLENGAKAQQARAVLPNSLKTEIVVTANPREWLHIFKLRTSREAHPQMQEVMIPLYREFATMWPTIFGEFKDEPTR